MLKKNVWIVALLVAALAMVFVGCEDRPGSNLGGAEEDLEITTSAAIGALLSTWGSQTTHSVAGNTLNVNFTGGTDGSGFRVDFPAEALETQYVAMEVTFKLTSATTLAAGENAKFGFKNVQGGGGEADITPYEDYEVVFGSGPSSAEITRSFSLNAPNRLPNNYLIIIHNTYGTPPNKGSSAPVNYTVQVTKIVFKAGELEPCCTDCDVTECRDCPDKCTGSCGTACCVVFNGDATTGAALVDGVVVHTNPALEFAGGTVVAADGTVTMKAGAVVFYTFPEDTATFKIEDFDYIDITYTLSNVVTTSGGAGALKAQLMDLENSVAYGFAGGGWTDWGTVGVDKTTRIQTWGDGGTGGFALRFNAYDSATSGCDSIDLKITKVEFSKGTRHTVAFFSPMTPANNNFPTLTVLSGNALRERMPKVSNPGWTFLGWVADWDGATNQPIGPIVTDTTAITGNTTLYASWSFVQEATALSIKVNGVDQEVSVIGQGHNTTVTYFPNGSGVNVTMTGGFEAAYIQFQVNLGAGKTLADFSKLVMDTYPVGGGYKPLAILASATKMTGNPATANLVIDSGTLGGAPNHLRDADTWTNNRDVPLNAEKAGAIEGSTIWIAIYVHEASGFQYRLRNIRFE